LNILFICHRIPFPPNKGEKIRAFHILKRLNAEHNVYLAFLVDDRQDLQHLEELKNYCVDFDYTSINPKQRKLASMLHLASSTPLSVPYFYSRKLQNAVDERLRTVPIDTIYCFSSPMAEYVFHSKALAEMEHKPRLVMDFVDVDSDKWRMYATFKKGIMRTIYKREERLLRDYEERVGKHFDNNVFISHKEVELFSSFCSDVETCVLANGVDLEYFSSVGEHRLQPGQRPTLLFMGAMDYYPNEDGVLNFVRTTWPLIKKDYPEARFIVVGPRPSKAVQQLGKDDPSIEITGFVPDIRDVMALADIFVAPLRIARGVQNKVLEAMAAGLPVVSSPEAAQGIPELHSCMKVADKPEAFAAEVKRFLQDKDGRRDLSERSKQLISECFCWGANMSKLHHILSDEKQTSKG
jgi:sugar transferase (PEP-CTERM/EpsH1 system associated)